MKLLNERHDYGLDLFLLSIDEGISGYRGELDINCANDWGRRNGLEHYFLGGQIT